MSKEPIATDFSVAKAILRDAIFKQSADLSNKEHIGILKLITAREENIDFEIGLAERICGDNNNFPYRSSYYITKFFRDLGYDFSHDGSTRRIWIKNVLLSLDTSQIASLIKNGLFRKADFKNPKLRTDRSKERTEEEFLSLAVSDFKKFIDESIRANEVLDITEVLDLNLNIDLLFQQQSATKDHDLNQLITEAKDRYLKPGDQVIALEKLWDAFERVKTYYDKDKKKSATVLVGQMASELDTLEFQREFETLTNIGNAYRIRHHESNKKPLTDPSQIKYLFFRMLALMDLAVGKIRLSDKGKHNSIYGEKG